MPDEIKQEDIPNPQTRTVEDLLAELKGNLDKEKTEDLYNRLEPYFKETINALLDTVEQRLDGIDGEIATINDDTSVESLRAELTPKFVDIRQELDQKIAAIKEVDEGALVSTAVERAVNSAGGKAQALFTQAQSQNAKEIQILKTHINESQTLTARVKEALMQELGALEKRFVARLVQLEKDFHAKLASVGSGNMNRNISIGGNSSVLSRYTDINFKAGANVTITYVNNNTTKNLDVTFAATGGSGSGIVRSVNNISTNTVAGSTATTDYVYLCTGPLTLTLPDATGNTNLYTVKNVGGGTTTINTTSSQTIDGGLTATLSTLYIEITLVSDGSNWNVGV